MYYVKKRLEISASHQLHLSYESKCENLHGHNWIITVYCRAKDLNRDGYGNRLFRHKERDQGKTRS